MFNEKSFMNKPAGRIVALDVGDKRIGVAISDESHLIASPLKILERNVGKPVEKILQLVRELGATTIVVGLPKNMDGSEGVQARKTREFAKHLAECGGDIQIELWDERLTTVTAHKILQETGPRKRRRQPVDAVSACVLLQSYLDALGRKLSD
jgi:putative Holliday junction resolvase